MTDELQLQPCNFLLLLAFKGCFFGLDKSSCLCHTFENNPSLDSIDLYHAQWDDMHFSILVSQILYFRPPLCMAASWSYAWHFPQFLWKKELYLPVLRLFSFTSFFFFIFFCVFFSFAFFFIFFLHHLKANHNTHYRGSSKSEEICPKIFVCNSKPHCLNLY